MFFLICLSYKVWVRHRTQGFGLELLERLVSECNVKSPLKPPHIHVPTPPSQSLFPAQLSSPEVRGKTLNQDLGLELLERFDGARKVVRATVGHVVAVHAAAEQVAGT